MKTSTALFIPILLMGAISCGPTTDTVVAPFELTSDFTSSTSPGDSAPPVLLCRDIRSCFVPQRDPDAGCEPRLVGRLRKNRG